MLQMRRSKMREIWYNLGNVFTEDDRILPLILATIENESDRAFLSTQYYRGEQILQF